MDVLIKTLFYSLLLVTIVFCGFIVWHIIGIRSFFKIKREEYIEEGHDDDN